MAFLAVDEKRASLPEDTKKAMQDAEVALIVKAHGFEPGIYKFDPNPNVQRRDGSIINGKVRGYFIMEECEDIVLDREDLGLGEKLWKRLCAKFGYKYHNTGDIDCITISPKSIKIDISLVTPTSEE